MSQNKTAPFCSLHRKTGIQINNTVYKFIIFLFSPIVNQYNLKLSNNYIYIIYMPIPHDITTLALMPESVLNNSWRYIEGALYMIIIYMNYRCMLRYEIN